VLFSGWTFVWGCRGAEDNPSMILPRRTSAGKFHRIQSAQLHIGELTDPDENANQFWLRFAKPLSIGQTNWIMRASLPINTYPVAPSLDHETGFGTSISSRPT